VRDPPSRGRGVTHHLAAGILRGEGGGGGRVSERAGEDAGTSPESIYARRRVHLVVPPVPFSPLQTAGAALSPSFPPPIHLSRLSSYGAYEGTMEEGGRERERAEGRGQGVHACPRRSPCLFPSPSPTRLPPRRRPPPVRAYVPPPESIVFH